jgi:CAAX protease family protein
MNWKKINLYILFSFAFSWTVAVIMTTAHIKLDSTTGMIFLAVLYMPGPALATLLVQKFIYKGGLKQYGWAFDKKSVRWIFLIPLVFLALTILTFAIVGLLGNTHLVPAFGQIDFSQENFTQRLKDLASSKINIRNVQIPEIPPKLLFPAMLLQGIIGGSTISLPFMFGEEFGWRGLMLTETRSLGFFKANVVIGFVWGIWHLPVILMGHNYPHHPYLGIAMMCLFTISLAPIFAYVRIKAKSILGSCMLHGMVNASGALYVLYIANWNELYSWIAGWAGIISALIVGICISLLDKKFVKEYRSQEW